MSTAALLLLAAAHAQGGPSLSLTVDLVDGTHLLGEIDAYSFELATDYGVLRVPLSDIASVERVEEAGHVRVSLRSGDRLTAVPPRAVMPLETSVGTVSVKLEMVERLLVHSGDGGLVLHWSFDAVRGGVVPDLSGNGHDGALHGSYTGVGGRLGRGLHLRTVSDYVRLDDLDVGGWTGLTVSVWARDSRPTTYGSLVSYAPTDGTKAREGFTLQSGGSGSHGVFVLAHDTEVFGVAKVEQKRSLTKVGTWVHLAATWDATGSRLYVDGELVAESGPSEHATLLDEPEHNSLLLGRAGGHRMGWGDAWFRGAVDDFRLYDRALSAEEIGALAQGEQDPGG